MSDWTGHTCEGASCHARFETGGVLIIFSKIGTIPTKKHNMLHDSAWLMTFHEVTRSHPNHVAVFVPRSESTLEQVSSSWRRQVCKVKVQVTHKN